MSDERRTREYSTDTTDWWSLPTEAKPKDQSKLAQAMTSVAKAVWEQDAWRRAESEQNLRRYSARGLVGLFSQSGYMPDQNNLRVNVSKNVTETLVSKVGSVRPRPKLLTSGADWSQRRRVKQLQRFTDAVIKATDLHGEGKKCFRQALIHGTGVMEHSYDVGKQTIVNRSVFPLELCVDEIEAVDGRPFNLFRCRFLDRAVLKAWLPEHKAAIERLPSADPALMPTDKTSDTVFARSRSMVQVWEAWHLATTTYRGDLVCGRRVMACDSFQICDEEWEHDYFPFSFFHWAPPQRGFWGDPALTEVRGLEKECNVLLQKAQRAMQLVGQPWILKRQGDKVSQEKITDEIALQVEYNGQVPPTVVSHQAINPQIIEHAFLLQRKAFEQLGTNEQQVAGLKPAGIESGRGLEQLSEEHLTRFKSVTQDYEKFLALDCTRQILRCAEELDGRLKGLGKPGYVVKNSQGRARLKIDWSDAKVSPDDLTTEVWPTSSLPNSPAGRTEEVERWQSNGWITPQRAMTLLEFPDLDSEIDLQTADTDLVEYQLEQTLELGKDCLPEEVQNIGYAKQRFVYGIERAIQDDVPQTHLDKARLFLEALKALETALTPPPQPAMMGGPGPVPGVVGPAANPLGMPPQGLPPGPPMGMGGGAGGMPAM